MVTDIERNNGVKVKQVIKEKLGYDDFLTDARGGDAADVGRQRPPMRLKDAPEHIGRRPAPAERDQRRALDQERIAPRRPLQPFSGG